ncbi:MAG: FixH family protein [Desulfuromonadales bacterium]|nr:FixH family protein [Desulfuromonadales bacterium]
MASSQRNFYKPFILLLLCSFLLFSGWSAWRAVNRGSQVTDRDYYSKGLKYNSTLVEKRAAEVLGWQLKTGISDNQLIFQLTDGSSLPVKAAVATLYLYLPETPEETPYQLSESQPGTYQVDLPVDLRGTLRARVLFERDGARLNRQLQLNL